jgi:hypothetical protein
MARKLRIALSAAFIAVQVLVTAYCVWAVISWGSRDGSGQPDVEWCLIWPGLSGVLSFMMTLLLARSRSLDWPTACVWGVWSDVVAAFALLPVQFAAGLTIELVVKLCLSDAAAVALDRFLVSNPWLGYVIAAVITALISAFCISMCYWRRKRES